jgi:hypothetical protein
VAPTGRTQSVSPPSTSAWICGQVISASGVSRNWGMFGL